MILGDTKKPSFKVNKNDNYNTPVQAWQFLLDNMQPDYKNKIIWSPFYYDGGLIKNLKDLDINLIHENKDFFYYEPEEYDMIIDNPPYSCKREIIERCLKLNKPFALLLPLDTIERHYMKDLFNSDTNKIQILIPRHTSARIYGAESSGNNPASDAYFVPSGVFSDPPQASTSLYCENWVSVATASIQEIDRQLQAEKARNDALEARISALENN